MKRKRPDSHSQAALQTEEQQKFFDLWLPLEWKIQRLTHGKISRRELDNETTRRKLLQSLLQEREQGSAQAQGVVEAFGEVLHLFATRTQRFLEQGGWSQNEAEAEALSQLSTNPEFLLQANAYATAFQDWLINFISPNEDQPSKHKRALGESSDRGVLSLEEPRKAWNYPIQTSQESMIIFAAMCSGRAADGWVSDLQAGTRTYSQKGVSHRVQIELFQEERDAGLSVAALEGMTRELDADGMFAVLYISRVLAPPAPLPKNALAYGWIELDDVIAKIGWKPRSTAERLQMRQAAWHYVRFCARANLIGERSTTFRDVDTKKVIPTRIEGPIWRFMKEEHPVQASLFAEEDVPLRVQIAVSPEWTRLTTSPLLSQFLPMGELLGQIPPDQPSGAWARALGIALSGFWRRNPRETLNDTLRPTRGELLTAYTPKVAPPKDILAGKNPKRALEYWRAALQILCENGFIARIGEALRSDEEIWAELPRYHWQQVWLEQKVEIRPGLDMTEAIQSCAENLPILKPRNLKTLAGKPPKTRS